MLPLIEKNNYGKRNPHEFLIHLILEVLGGVTAYMGPSNIYTSNVSRHLLIDDSQRLPSFGPTNYRHMKYLPTPPQAL